MTWVVKHILIFSNLVNYCEVPLAFFFLLLSPFFSHHLLVTLRLCFGFKRWRRKKRRKEKFVAESRKLYFLIKLIVEERSTPKPFSIMHHHWPEPRDSEESGRGSRKKTREQNYELDIKNMIFIKSWKYFLLSLSFFFNSFILCFAMQKSRHSMFEVEGEKIQ